MVARILQIAATDGAMYSRAVGDVVSGGEPNWPLKYKNMGIDHLVTGSWPIVKQGPPMLLKSFAKDLHGVDIINNLSTHPVWFRNRKKTILIGSAHELQHIQFPELTPLVDQSLSAKIWRQTITAPASNACLARIMLVLLPSSRGRAC